MQVIAAVQRQVDDAAVLNHGPHRGIIGVQLYGRGSHFDGFTQLPDLQREIQPRSLLNLQLNVVIYGRPKTWLLDPNVIESRLEGRKVINSRSGRDRFACRVGSRVGHSDLSSYNHGAGSVLNFTRYLPKCLTENRHGKQNAEYNSNRTNFHIAPPFKI